MFSASILLQILCAFMIQMLRFWFINWRNFLLEFQVVANYYGNRKIYEKVETNRIHWAGGRLDPPPDTPECGFDGSGCPPDGNIIYF